VTEENDGRLTKSTLGVADGEARCHESFENQAETLVVLGQSSSVHQDVVHVVKDAGDILENIG
jgi:hypothetical protein